MQYIKMQPASFWPSSEWVPRMFLFFLAFLFFYFSGNALGSQVLIYVPAYTAEGVWEGMGLGDSILCAELERGAAERSAKTLRSLGWKLAKGFIEGVSLPLQPGRRCLDDTQMDHAKES